MAIIGNFPPRVIPVLKPGKDETDPITTFISLIARGCYELVYVTSERRFLVIRHVLNEYYHQTDLTPITADDDSAGLPRSRQSITSEWKSLSSRSNAQTVVM